MTRREDQEAGPAPLPSVGASAAQAAGSAKIAKAAPPHSEDSGGDLPVVDRNSSLKAYVRQYRVILPTLAVGVVAFEVVHTRWSGAAERVDLRGTEDLTRASRFFEGMWPLTQRLLYDVPVAGLARTLLVVLLSLGLLDIYINWCFNIWSKEFWDSIEAKKMDAFWAAMNCFVWLAFTHILVSTYHSYVQRMLSILWRTELTRQFQEIWVMGRGFWLTRTPNAGGRAALDVIDNPDQRLQDDTASFTGDSIPLFLGFLRALGKFLVFVPWLYIVSPEQVFGLDDVKCKGWLVYAVLLYSLAGSVIAHLIGRRLAPLAYTQQRAEADFRHSAMQVHDQAENIALLGAQEAENRRMTRLFGHVQGVFWEYMFTAKRLDFFTAMYGQTGEVVPICMLAGNYFRGQMSLGGIMQVLSAVNHVKGSVDFFLDEYQSFVNLRATANRLWRFLRAAEKTSEVAEGLVVERGPELPAEEQLAIVAKGICMELPGGSYPEDRGKELWRDAGLDVQAGEHVLLLGPDGCGKSSFVRALAGCFAARGCVQLGPSGALFVPQQPFIPAGTLREAATYPDPPEAYGDEGIREALGAVGLGGVTDGIALEESVDWQHQLSGGERQRLLLAHAILRRPGLLVLDETTASIGEEGTLELYRELGRRLPQTAVITVGHDADAKLAGFHTRHLTYDPEARKWKPVGFFKRSSKTPTAFSST